MKALLSRLRYTSVGAYEVSCACAKPVSSLSMDFRHLQQPPQTRHSYIECMGLDRTHRRRDRLCRVLCVCRMQARCRGPMTTTRIYFSMVWRTRRSCLALRRVHLVLRCRVGRVLQKKYKLRDSGVVVTNPIYCNSVVPMVIYFRGSASLRQQDNVVSSDWIIWANNNCWPIYCNSAVSMVIYFQLSASSRQQDNVISSNSIIWANNNCWPIYCNSVMPMVLYFQLSASMRQHDNLP